MPEHITERENLEVKFNLRQWSIIGKVDVDFNHLETPGHAFLAMNYWDINYEVRYNTIPAYTLLSLTYRLDIKPKAQRT